MTLFLERAKNIERDGTGAPCSWTSGDEIASFKGGTEFTDYVTEHINELTDAAAFSGSASLIVDANAFLGQELKKAGLI